MAPKPRLRRRQVERSTWLPSRQTRGRGPGRCGPRPDPFGARPDRMSCARPVQAPSVSINNRTRSVTCLTLPAMSSSWRCPKRTIAAGPKAGGNMQSPCIPIRLECPRAGPTVPKLGIRKTSWRGRSVPAAGRVKPLLSRRRSEWRRNGRSGVNSQRRHFMPPLRSIWRSSSTSKGRVHAGARCRTDRNGLGPWSQATL